MTKIYLSNNLMLSVRKRKKQPRIFFICFTLLFTFLQQQAATAQTAAGLLADKMIFSSSSAGSVTYTAITTGGGATAFQSGAAVATNAVSAVTITSLTNGTGFGFTFDGVTYSAVNISNNGFITFGATAPNTNNNNPVSSGNGYAGCVAGYGINLVASTVAGASPAILYQVTGASPNREFVVQYQDVARNGLAAADRMNFQIRLVETSNVIKIVYGAFTTTSATTSAGDFGQIGLRGESNTDFHARMVASSGTNNTTWANSGCSGDNGGTTTQTTDDNTAGINCVRFNSGCLPSAASTLTYTWTPVAGSFYQTIPYTQNFDSWVDLQGLKDVPASTGVINWPASGHLSWRNITGTAPDAAWSSLTGNFAAPTTKAGAGSATFNQYNAASGTKGVMDFFLNFSSAGTKAVDFYVRNPGTTSANDILQVFLSTDGGVSFIQIGTDIAAPAPSPATAWSAKQTLTLGASTAANCILRFQGVSDYGSSAENLAIDELSVYLLTACSNPTDQPTALNLTSVTSTTLSGSFNAAIPAPTGGYIALRSTSSTPPALVNGTTYTTGSAYTISGNSYTVVSNGFGTSFTQTGLTANTQYFYYVISYNGSCTGAPFYLTASPLTSNALTCTAAPSLSGVQTGTSSANITFSTVAGAASYILQYSVAGANAWIIASPAPVSSPYSLTGLSAGTAYDIRMEAPNSNCGTLTTTPNAFTTQCTSLSLPVTQGFEAGTAIPPCWTQQYVTTPNKAFSYGSSTTAAGTTPNPVAASGSNRLLFPSFTNNGSQTRFYSPVIITTGTSSVDVQFQWYFSTNGTATSYLTEGVQVQWSTNGTTWTNAGSLIRRYGATDGWQKQTLTLPAGAGNQPVLYVGFLLTSNAGYDSYIDDIVIKATPPCNYAGTAAAASNSICGGSGSTTLSAVDYSVSGAGLTYQWQYSSDNFVADINSLPSGTNPAAASTGTITSTRYYRLRVSCTALGASYSNIVTVVVGTYTITGTTPASRCGIGTVTLGAAASAGSTISWYTTATGGLSVGTGNSFTTPAISSTTNYYVGANNGATLATIGATYSGTLDNTTGTGSHGIVIATTSPNIVIISAKIPFTGKGTFTIQLQTTAGTVVSSITTDTLVGGGNIPVAVPINIAVTTPGTYRLIVSSITGTINSLGYITTASYPYTGLGGAFSVTAGYWFGNDATDNMYLFNLVVSNVCESARSVVTATVTPPPALTTDAASATICSGGSTTVNVTSAAGNFSTYNWLPATGVTASGSPAGITVTFNPTVNTNYTLTATSASGCVNQVTVTITVNPAPPVTTSAAICSGGAATLTSSSTCSNLSPIGNAISGSWNAGTDAIAVQPIIFLPNSTTCEFDPDGHTMNYTTINFQVSVSGIYNFLMDNNTLDGMGYIVTGAFVPGQCPGTGTWIVGDDDSGPGLMPMMDATLTAGITYTLITTVFSYSSGTSTGAYNWAITPPPGGQIATGTTGTLRWYTAASGGSPIATGSPFNPVGVTGSGIASNTSVGSYTFYAACSNNTTCRTTATYVIGSAGQWIGGTNTDWSNTANWCGGVPTISTDATIVAGAPYMPVLASGTGTVKNLIVNTGATLAINNATMQIAGTITATNAVTASAGTIELAGSTAQAISGSSFTNRSIQNLKASNSVNVSAAANDSLKITGALSFGNVNSKVFSSGNNVILVSSATATARVADITNNGANSGNTFTGNFQVQRYIPARRAWRLMTAPIAAGTLTIKQAWQEGVGGAWASNPSPGYGTHITGGPTRTTAQGYDQGPFNPSIYGHTATGWNYLPATTNELITSNQGWLLFIRGSRAINLPLSTPSTVPDATILRPTGAIKYGVQPALTNSTGGYMVVGNPYASPINFKNISRTGVIGGIGGNNAYYLWDPALGGANGVGAYVAFSWNGTAYDKSIVVGGGSSNIGTNGMIPSSAAFLVNQSAGGTVSIEENDKDTVVYTPTYVFRPTANPSSLRISLYGTEPDSSKGILDGSLISFHESSSTAVDNEDAVKMNNVRETFAIIKDGKKIAIERRNLLQVNDTLFYKMWNMRQRNYEFEVALTNVELPAGTAAFFEDVYRHQKTMLNDADTTRISFDVSADSSSSIQDRFRIVIEPAGVVPVTFIDVKAYEIGHNINVEWTVQNELNIVQYEVERSSDGINFSSIKSADPRGGNVTYNLLDEDPVMGNNYYRVKSIDNTGRIKYSRIVKVYIGKGKPAVTVYPNPVTDDVISIAFSNVSPGIYSVKLYNAVGQLVFVKQITHTEGSSSSTIRFDGKTAKGLYQLEVTSQEGNKNVFKLVLQ